MHLKLSTRLPLALLALTLSVSTPASPASAKCMARALQAPVGGADSAVVVVPDGASDLKALGYKETSCEKMDKEAYRAKVCDPRTFGNSGVQRQLEVHAGVSFAQLCTGARAEAGLPALSAEEMKRRFMSLDPAQSVPPHGAAMAGSSNDPQSANASAKGN